VYSANSWTALDGAITMADEEHVKILKQRAFDRLLRDLKAEEG
jgi:hypothetical protein